MTPWKRGGRPRRAEPEHKFHVAVAQYLNYALRSDSWWTTIPTAGSSMLQGAKIKARGYRKGTPDIVICWGSRAFWIELKAADGRMDPDQIAQHAALSRANCKVTTVYTIDQLEHWLRHWGIPLRATLAPEPAQVKAARETA